MTGAQIDCVEKMLTRFIEKSVKGIKKDYFRKMMRVYSAETSMETVSVADEFHLSKSRTACSGSCAACSIASICAAMDELTERQELIIKKLIVEKYTEDEISVHLGISQQAVSYHKTEGIKKLRKIISNENRSGPALAGLPQNICVKRS